MSRLEAAHLLVDGTAQVTFGGVSTRSGVGFVFQTMAAPIGNLLESYFYLRQASGADFDFDTVSKLWTITGTPGTDAVPDTLLATSEIVNAQTIPSDAFPNLPASRILYAFTGGAQVALDPETYYAITVEVEEDADEGKGGLAIASQNPSENNGNELLEQPEKSGTWVAALGSHNRCFEVWATEGQAGGGGAAGGGSGSMNMAAGLSL